MPGQTLNESLVHLIFGASGGIGSEVARRLAASGATVALASKQAGRRIDLTNLAGNWEPRSGILTSMSRPELIRWCPRWSSGSAAKVMRQCGGSIVLVSSAAVRIGLANHEAIAAAKAGVIGLTLSAAATYASKGIRVNAVAPGLVRTAMTERIWGNVKSAEASQSLHALGRLGEPADVASCITWLLDPTNAWVTGQVIGVDGGLASLRTREPSERTHLVSEFDHHRRNGHAICAVPREQPISRVLAQ